MTGVFDSPEAFATLAMAAGFGYLLGSIPFGLIFTRMAGLGDVRSIGSGNIGATNVLRTGNKKVAAATLLADMLKATLAALVAGNWGHEAALAAGFFAFIGHCYPVWLKFKGGKGVATYLGTLLGIAWPGALVFAGVWLAVAALFRISSLAALMAMVAAPAFLWWQGMPLAAGVLALMSLLSFHFHRQNISRLLSGTESRIGSKG